MPGAVLTLTGSPTVANPDGTRVTPQPGAKALALLTYLTLEPRPHTREALADLLWGESPEAEARASLRQALKQLESVTRRGGTIRPAAGRARRAGALRCSRIHGKGGPGAGGGRRARHSPVPSRVLHPPRPPIRRLGRGDPVEPAPAIRERPRHPRPGRDGPAALAGGGGAGRPLAGVRPPVRGGGPGGHRGQVPRGGPGGGAGQARRVPGGAAAGDGVRALPRLDRAGPADRDRRRSGAPPPG